MNLDELMAVWKTQDVAPLHDMNRTLLHLALREEEAKLQKARRRERWMVYLVGAGFVASMAVFLGMMILGDEREDMTSWDFVIGITGAAAVLLAGRALYVDHRAQARREERFGESLRDQLNRRIAQLDYAATRAPRTGALVLVMLGVIAPVAGILLSLRTNQKSVLDNKFLIVSMILICVWCVAGSAWDIRRKTRDVVLPHKRRLEALLKELDDQ